MDIDPIGAENWRIELKASQGLKRLQIHPIAFESGGFEFKNPHDNKQTSL